MRSSPGTGLPLRIAETVPPAPRAIVRNILPFINAHQAQSARLRPSCAKAMRSYPRSSQTSTDTDYPRPELFFESAESAFQNLGGNLLCLDGVIIFSSKLVRSTRFDSRSFLFGVAIAREKLIHFSLKSHFFVSFLWVDSADDLPRAQRKVQHPLKWPPFTAHLFVPSPKCCLRHATTSDSSTGLARNRRPPTLPPRA